MSKCGIIAEMTSTSRRLHSGDLQLQMRESDEFILSKFGHARHFSWASIARSQQDSYRRLANYFVTLTPPPRHGAVLARSLGGRFGPSPNLTRLFVDALVE